MGGINSGNYREDKKGLVEDCMVLASAELMPNGRAQRRGVQTYHWVNPLTGQKRGSINCEVSVPWDGPASVRFKYRLGPPPGEALDYTVSLADWEILTRAEATIFGQLTAGLTLVQRHQLDQLIADSGSNGLGWLRQAVGHKFLNGLACSSDLVAGLHV